MFKKLKEKYFNKHFQAFFNELLRQKNLIQLSTAITNYGHNEENMKTLYCQLKAYRKQKVELLELFHDIQSLQQQPETIKDLYNRIRELGRTDEELLGLVSDTLSVLERNGGVNNIQHRLNNAIQNDYNVMLPNHGKNLHIAYGAQIYCGEHITIGDNFHAGFNLRIQAVDRYGDQLFNPNMIIGNNVSFEDHCHIGCAENIEIGDNTLIASKVFITDHFHGNITKHDLESAPAKRLLSTKPVKIGKNVWIGEGVSIMPGVTLGDNVIVGTNAVVTHSFEANSIIAGCPAKLIRKLQ